jgi:hypothetical protein
MTQTQASPGEVLTEMKAWLAERAETCEPGSEHAATYSRWLQALREREGEVEELEGIVKLVNDALRAQGVEIPS